MTEKIILITLMHENTQYFFLFFPFLKSLGGFAPLPLYGAAPDNNNDNNPEVQ